MFRYLDRPVFQAERVAAAAWTVGGAEAEREARTRQAEQEENICLAICLVIGNA